MAILGDFDYNIVDSTIVDSTFTKRLQFCKM